jgi:ribosomal protein L7Ae-like RNA K-turn-binding protein
MSSNAHLCTTDSPEVSGNVQRLLIGTAPLQFFELANRARRQAHLAVLAESCDSEPYTQLIEALCAEHNINLIKIADGKKLGEWAGLCVLDREGNARKVVGASCVVVKDYGEESEALSVLLDYFKTR